MDAKQRFIVLVGAPVAVVMGILIPREEKVVLATYRDPVGIITSCAGHVDPTLRMGMKFTAAQCNEQMYEDLIKHTVPIIKCIGQVNWDRMPGPQKVGAIDFAYNKGVTAFCTSTYKRQLAEQSPAACSQPLRWNYANGGKVDCRIRSNNCYGVILRNQRNSRMCTGDMSDLGIDIDFSQTGTPAAGEAL